MWFGVYPSKVPVTIAISLTGLQVFPEVSVATHHTTEFVAKIYLKFFFIDFYLLRR